MAKTKKTGKKDSFQEDYSKIMGGFSGVVNNQNYQVTTPADVFVKFSLHTQSPMTTTSTNTQR